MADRLIMADIGAQHTNAVESARPWRIGGIGKMNDRCGVNRERIARRNLSGRGNNAGAATGDAPSTTGPLSCDHVAMSPAHNIDETPALGAPAVRFTAQFTP
jgi:hypothetical protein